jgi:hypothetical protein
VRRKTAIAMRAVIARWAACGVELDEPRTK